MNFSASPHVSGDGRIEASCLRFDSGFFLFIHSDSQATHCRLLISYLELCRSTIFKKENSAGILQCPFITVEHDLTRPWFRHSRIPSQRPATPPGTRSPPHRPRAHASVTTMEVHAHGTRSWAARELSTKIMRSAQRWSKRNIHCGLSQIKRSTMSSRLIIKWQKPSPHKLLVQWRRWSPRELRPL